MNEASLITTNRRLDFEILMLMDVIRFFRSPEQILYKLAYLDELPASTITKHLRLARRNIRIWMQSLTHRIRHHVLGNGS